MPLLTTTYIGAGGSRDAISQDQVDSIMNSPAPGDPSPLDSTGTNSDQASNPNNPLGSLEDPSQDPYVDSTYMYPLDLDTLPHCMVFHINVQQASASQEQVISGVTSVSQQIRSGQLGNTPRAISNDVKTFSQTQRIATTIQLYMPETAISSLDQDYDTKSLLDLHIPGISAAAEVFKDWQSGNFDWKKELAGPGVTMLADATGVVNNPTVKSLITLGFGYAINPTMEVIYNQPSLREFDFSFLFSPRSQDEAIQVKNIIRQFRRHASPALGNPNASSINNTVLPNVLGSNPNGQTIAQAIGGNIPDLPLSISGAFFIPPSTFDISFLSGGAPNPILPKLSSCVITSISADYAPQNQFVTHDDGMPVVIRLSMRFKELDIITRDLVDLSF